MFKNRTFILTLLIPLLLDLLVFFSGLPVFAQKNQSCFKQNTEEIFDSFCEYEEAIEEEKVEHFFADLPLRNRSIRPIAPTTGRCVHHAAASRDITLSLGWIRPLLL